MIPHAGHGHGRGRRRRVPPPWWPAGEPWPPPGPGAPWRRAPVRIRQVLANLLANAVRHTPPGGRVTVEARPDQEDPGWVRFCVADTGPGLPPDELPGLFDRFTKSADSGGSGLGLAIARDLVAAHGGDIGAANRPGGGAEVWFRLPLRS